MSAYITLYNSYSIKKKDYKEELLKFREEHRDSIVVKNRGLFSMIMELSSHNLLYSLGIAREHTRHCDFEYPQKWYLGVGYFVIGMFGYLVNP